MFARQERAFGPAMSKGRTVQHLCLLTAHGGLTFKLVFVAAWDDVLAILEAALPVLTRARGCGHCFYRNY